jgi:hypothetical protein
MLADPMKTGAAPLRDFDKVRDSAGFPSNRSGRGSEDRHRRYCETDKPDKHEYHYTHLVPSSVARHYIKTLYNVQGDADRI